MEVLQKELDQKKRTIEDLEASVKLQSRLATKTNQPQSYIIADLENAERQLDFAQRKIKQYEDVVKKVKHENEQLKLQKRGLADDLQKLVNKREDIEKLQQTLMGIIQHSSSKKIDVDDLKGKLAESVRRDKYKQPFAANSLGGDATLKKGKRSGRSKSPMDNNVSYSNSDLNTYGQENQSTIKMYQEEDSTPAWYRTLKKNL